MPPPPPPPPPSPLVLGVPDGLRPSSFKDLQDGQEEATTFQMVAQSKLFPCWVLEVEITTLLLGHMVTACRGLWTPLPSSFPPAQPSPPQLFGSTQLFARKTKAGVFAGISQSESKTQRNKLQAVTCEAEGVAYNHCEMLQALHSVP